MRFWPVSIFIVFGYPKVMKNPQNQVILALRARIFPICPDFWPSEISLVLWRRFGTLKNDRNLVNCGNWEDAVSVCWDFSDFWPPRMAAGGKGDKPPKADLMLDVSEDSVI